MKRTIYRYDKESGRVVAVAEAKVGERVHIISDKLDKRIWHPAFDDRNPDGSINKHAFFDSKSEFEKATVRSGFRTVGNDTIQKAPNTLGAENFDYKGALARARATLKGYHQD